MSHSNSWVLITYQISLEHLESAVKSFQADIEELSNDPLVFKTTIFSATKSQLLDVRNLLENGRKTGAWNVYFIKSKARKRLAIFDLDSTLIQQETIDEIADFANVGSQVAELTQQAMDCGLDFNIALQQRVKLLKGLPASVLHQVLNRLTLTPGARELCELLKFKGFKIAVISGGFQEVADFIKCTLKLDYAFANKLQVDVNGYLTGELAGDIVNGQKKLEIMKLLCMENKLSIYQSLAIGDGANDLPMLNSAGLGIAFNAKPNVQRQAPIALNTDTLFNIKYLLDD